MKNEIMQKEVTIGGVSGYSMTQGHYITRERTATVVRKTYYEVDVWEDEVGWTMCNHITALYKWGKDIFRGQGKFTLSDIDIAGENSCTKMKTPKDCDFKDGYPAYTSYKCDKTGRIASIPSNWLAPAFFGIPEKLYWSFKENDPSVTLKFVEGRNRIFFLSGINMPELRYVRTEYVNTRATEGCLEISKKHLQLFKNIDREQLRNGIERRHFEEQLALAKEREEFFTRRANASR